MNKVIVGSLPGLVVPQSESTSQGGTSMEGNEILVFQEKGLNELGFMGTHCDRLCQNTKNQFASPIIVIAKL